MVGNHHFHLFINQWLFLVSLKGGRDYITPQNAIYKWYILPIGGLYATYHLLGEPETTIEFINGCLGFQAVVKLVRITFDPHFRQPDGWKMDGREKVISKPFFRGNENILKRCHFNDRGCFMYQHTRPNIRPLIWVIWVVGLWVGSSNQRISPTPGSCNIAGWKMNPLKMYLRYFLLNVGIFHCYVSLPQGTLFFAKKIIAEKTLDI